MYPQTIFEFLGIGYRLGKIEHLQAEEFLFMFLICLNVTEDRSWRRLIMNTYGLNLQWVFTQL